MMIDVIKKVTGMAMMGMSDRIQTGAGARSTFSFSISFSFPV
jgi:hypothetical protein